MRLNIDIPDLNRVMHRIESYTDAKLDGIKRVVVESAVNIESTAVSLAPEDEGNLKNSIHTDISNEGLTADVTASAEYAAHVEFGTDPHVIKASPGKTLAFKMDGKMVFRKQVNHPGTKAQPFMFPAWERERPRYLSALRSELRRIK